MKKLTTYLALTAVTVNMGIATAVFAQNTQNVSGTLNIDCPAVTRTFYSGDNINARPRNFQIGSTGSRAITGSNDTVYNETTQSAYFENINLGVFDITNNNLTIQSNTPFSCGASTRGVKLAVSATQFKNASNEVLMTYGSDGAVGGTGTAEDYYYIFSANTSAAPHCSSPCTKAQGANESITSPLNGKSNLFANPGPHNKTHATSGDPTALLHSSDGTPNTVVLYNITNGFEGSVEIPNLDYNLTLPSYIANAGTYTSTVTYTLSAT